MNLKGIIILPATRIVENYINSYIKVNKNINYLEQMLWIDNHLILPDDLLVKMDIATMANSLEARSLFLDNELVDLATKLPPNIKLKRKQTKPLLRSIAEKYLPQEVINAPKRGFEVPLVKWINNDLKDMIRDLFITNNAKIYNYVNQDEIKKFIYSTNVDSKKHASLIWAFLCLELWLKNND